MMLNMLIIRWLSATVKTKSNVIRANVDLPDSLGSVIVTTSCVKSPILLSTQSFLKQPVRRRIHPAHESSL